MNIPTLTAILFAIGAIVAFPASALAEEDSDQQRTEKHKEMKLQGIEGRISILQQEQSCVQAATNRDAFRSCEQTSHQAMDQLMQKQKEGWESMKKGNQRGKTSRTGSED